jgi:uncharacterized protein (DUF58 family)
VIPTWRLVLAVAAGSPLWLLGAVAPTLFALPVAYLLLLAALAVWGAARAPGPRDLTVRRLMPARFSLGARQAVTLAVTNRTGRRLRVEARDDIPGTFGVFWGDPAALAPWATAEICYEVVSLARGRVKLARVYLRVSQGLELTQRQIPLSCVSEAKVYPAYLGVDQYDLLALRDLRDDAARAPRTSRGQGSDFESLRAYASGDDPRRIDWKISAKRGSLVSRNHQVDRGQQLTILLDAGRFMGEVVAGRPRFEHAADAAVVLASVAKKRGDWVSLACFSNRIDAYVPPLRGEQILPGVLEALCEVQPRPVESDYGHVFAGVLSRLRKRCLIVLFCELLDRASSSSFVINLARIARQHLVLAVVLRDASIQRALEMDPHDLAQTYLKAAASHVMMERAMALDDMRSRGMMVLETEPRLLSPHLINEYLAIRRSNLL